MAQDPRAEALIQIYELRIKLNNLEELIGSIPHAKETYDVPFVGAQPGDYMHPETATHPIPAQLTVLGDGAANWDSAYQCWVQPNSDENDPYSIAGNLNPNMSYDNELEEWQDTGEDWSNNYEAPIPEDHPIRANEAYEELENLDEQLPEVDVEQ